MSYIINYQQNPSSYFDFVESWDNYGNGMKIKYIDNSEELLTKKRYIQLNKK